MPKSQGLHRETRPLLTMLGASRSCLDRVRLAGGLSSTSSHASRPVSTPRRPLRHVRPPACDLISLRSSFRPRLRRPLSGTQCRMSCPRSRRSPRRLPTPTRREISRIFGRLASSMPLTRYSSIARGRPGPNASPAQSAYAQPRASASVVRTARRRAYACIAYRPAGPLHPARPRLPQPPG